MFAAMISPGILMGMIPTGYCENGTYPTGSCYSGGLPEWGGCRNGGIPAEGGICRYGGQLAGP